MLWTIEKAAFSNSRRYSDVWILCPLLFLLPPPSPVFSLLSRRGCLCGRPVTCVSITSEAEWGAVWFCLGFSFPIVILTCLLLRVVLPPVQWRLIKFCFQWKEITETFCNNLSFQKQTSHILRVISRPQFSLGPFHLCNYWAVRSVKVYEGHIRQIQTIYVHIYYIVSQ